MASIISNDWRSADLVTGAASDVAFNRLRVLHIRFNLPEH
jgi:hypothetical protein